MKKAVSIYHYNRDLFTVEFNGEARPTPRERVLDFAQKAVAQGYDIVIDMSHRGRNNADLALSETFTEHHIPHTIEE